MDMREVQETALINLCLSFPSPPQVMLHILSAGPKKPMGLDAPLSVWFTGQLPNGEYVQHPWQVPMGAISTAHSTLIMHVSVGCKWSVVSAQWDTFV